MNFGQFANAAAQKAQKHQECTECFEPLCNHPVVYLCDEKGKRSCVHIFHEHCVDRTTVPTCCTLCRKLFASARVLPSAIQNPEGWFKAVDIDDNGSLSYDELVDGLKAQVKLDWSKIEMDVDKLFSKWDHDKNGTISLKEFSDPVNGVLAYLKTHFAPHVAIKQVPDIRKDKAGWFQYWDEDGTGNLDKSEVSRALIKTLKHQNIDRHAVVNIIDCIWPMFDADGSGSVDMSEFTAPDGLADTVIAQLTYM